MTKALSIDGLIAVSTVITKTAGQSQTTSALLALTPSSVIDLQERMRAYASLAAVATDFGTSGVEYLMASIWFAQTPTPSLFYIGTWAQAARAGRLVGASLSAAAQLIANWTAITTGAFKVAVDGGAVTGYGPLNFSGVSNLNGVAAIISTALGVAGSIVWNANYSRFELTSSTAGASSAVSFLTAPASGTDIGALLGMTAAISGSYSVNGAIAETALAAATLFDASFGQKFYGLAFSALADADHIAVAGFIQASTVAKHTYWVTTAAAGTLNSAGTTDLAYLLSLAGYSRTFCQYSSTTAYAALSAASLMLSVDYTGSNTVIDLMYQTEPGVTPEQINQTQANSVLARNCNILTLMEDGTSIVQTGTMCSGDFVDEIVGADALAIAMTSAIYSELRNGRVAQTDAGMHTLLTDTEVVGAQFVTNGFLAPGQWNGPLFGALQNTSDGTPPFLSKGYYAYCAPVATQAQAQRAARIAVPIQFAGKLAGSVHKPSVAITINP